MTGDDHSLDAGSGQDVPGASGPDPGAGARVGAGPDSGTGDTPEARTIVLLGVPGAGVSTSARAVAGALGLPLRDTDDLVADRLGAPVHELVVDLGESEFRAAESAVAAEALGGDPLEEPAVVALGSGAIDAATERLADLRGSGAVVVHLRITPGTAMRRLGLSGLGSVALPNPRAMWTTMAAERDAALAAVATVTIDTTTMNEEQVLAAVLEVVRGD
ncbi:shikimate kinase [Georgenia sp. Z1344]|uniref:shikimate kinase n=1 Tax=Georgenia sp. Z1344 TaxID=3416706 RepID=UPI003CEEED61